MKYKTQNGWTKAAILQRLRQKTGKQRCSDRHGICRYRLNGQACFVGAFIPDEKYKIDMEGKSTGSLFIYFPEVLADMPLEAVAMETLQGIHDRTPEGFDPVSAAEQWLEENVEDAS